MSAKRFLILMKECFDSATAKKTRQADAQRVEEPDAPTEERQKISLPLCRLNTN
jgi:hypothetical protein